MDVTFQNRLVSCLNPVVRETQNCEQTQEIRLSEGMPDVGRILSAWGQPILRGKQWDTDTLNYTGGMMVWVLYAPEDGSPERCIEGWIPFQLHWDLPEDQPEGQIRLRMLPRLVDARTVSPRKILVRAGMGMMAEAFVPTQIPVPELEEAPNGVELLRRTYPVRLMKEAGEKSFVLDEELTLPEDLPRPEQIIYYNVEPRVTDRKVLSEKVVFRGDANLHTLYRGDDGQLHSWDFALPFSQYAELSGEYGPEAQAEFALCPTSMELELDEGGQLHFKCGVTAQYGITDREQLSVVEDAYSPNRELTMQTQTLELPAILENRRETAYPQGNLPSMSGAPADVRFLPDFPRQKYRGDGVELELPGVFQSLSYGEDGALEAGTVRWDGALHLNADENTQLTAVPAPASVQSSAGSVKAEMPLELTAGARQQLPVVAGLTLGQERKPDPSRPCLILRRAGNESLWQIAKAAHSTVGSIREANELQAEPAPGQLLLIPIL